MALNWVQTTAEGDKPVPLPQEKIFLSIEKCNLSLEFSSTKQKWTADGTCFVTSQRIVFLRQPALPPIDPTTPSNHLRSLSVPIERLLESRYMIPIFSSPYYEARVLPVKDGGLPQPVRQIGTSGTQDAGLGLLKIWFSQGGGIQFREAVEEVKNRLDEQGGKLNHLEQLPSYEPPPSPSIISGSSSSTTTQGPNPNLSSCPPPSNAPPQSTTRYPEAEPEPSIPATRTTPTRSGTLAPDSQDLEAARVAREIEERENLENLQDQQNRPPPAPIRDSEDQSQREDGDGVVTNEAPPGYQEACEIER